LTNIKKKETHSTGENLVLPGGIDVVQTGLGESFTKDLRKISKLTLEQEAYRIFQKTFVIS
jgi:hypothetical protein